jgi:uncharacterized membrane protein
LEWDSVIDGNETDRLVSWHSISEPDVGIQGAAVFEELSPDRTRIIFTIQYEPPGGPIGTLIAQIFSNPQKMVKEDVNNFKELIEQGVRSPNY